MPEASAPESSRDWRIVALTGCASFPISFALFHYVVPLGAWAAAASESLLSAFGAGLTTLLAMLLATIAVARRMQVNNRRMRVAINNMSQGLCMFDGDERLVVCNRRYLDLYQLPDEVVKPGRTLASRMQKIDASTTAVSASVQQQNAATSEQNVADGADGARLVVSVLGNVTGAASETRESAESVLTAS